MSEYKFGFLVVAACLLVAVLFVFATLLFGRLVRPRRPSREKGAAYECGERAIGEAWFSFNPRFYVIALIFVMFDVEIAVTYPVALIFAERVRSGHGLLVYVEIALFLLILLVGLAYVWRKGDLEWVKQLDPETDKTESEGN